MNTFGIRFDFVRRFSAQIGRFAVGLYVPQLPVYPMDMFISVPKSRRLRGTRRKGKQHDRAQDKTNNPFHNLFLLLWFCCEAFSS